MPQEKRSMVFTAEEIKDILADFAGYSREHTDAEYGVTTEKDDSGFIVLSVTLSSTKTVERQRVVHADPAKLGTDTSHFYANNSEQQEPVELAPGEAAVGSEMFTVPCPKCNKKIDVDAPKGAAVTYPVYCKKCGEKFNFGQLKSAKEALKGATVEAPRISRERRMLKNQDERLENALEDMLPDGM